MSEISQMKDPFIVPNTPIDYKANDWFYMNPSKCKLRPDNKTYEDSECTDNLQSAIQLQNTTNDLDTSRTQYNDAKLLYNRELLFTVNMLAGLALLCYYIYLNQSVFPTPTQLMEGAKKASASLTTVASSTANKLAMRPTV